MLAGGGRHPRTEATLPPMTETESPSWEIDVAPPRPPWVQMAIDRWLLHRAEAGGGGPVVRLYQWDRPTLTLGRHQDMEADNIDLDACERLGVAVVRRPTGGRAVFHGLGITYAIVAPLPHPGATVIACYRWAIQPLIAALAALSLPVAELGRTHGATGEAGLRAACYAAPSAGEVALAGRKWIGSAQRRLRRCFLQHGAIPFTVDVGALADCLRFPDHEARQRWAAALERCTADPAFYLTGHTADDLAAAIADGYRRHHRFDRWRPLHLPAEVAEAAEAARRDPRWTAIEGRRVVAEVMGLGSGLEGQSRTEAKSRRGGETGDPAS